MCAQTEDVSHCYGLIRRIVEVHTSPCIDALEVAVMTFGQTPTMHSAGQQEVCYRSHCLFAVFDSANETDSEGFVQISQEIDVLSVAVSDMNLDLFVFCCYHGHCYCVLTTRRGKRSGFGCWMRENAPRGGSSKDFGCAASELM